MSTERMTPPPGSGIYTGPRDSSFERAGTPNPEASASGTLGPITAEDVGTLNAAGGGKVEVVINNNTGLATGGPAKVEAPPIVIKKERAKPADPKLKKAGEDITALQGQVDTLAQQNQALGEAIVHSDENLRQTNAAAVAARNEAARLAQELTQTNQRLQQANTLVAAHQNEVTRLSGELNQANQRIAQSEQTIKGLQGQINALGTQSNAEVDKLRKELQTQLAIAEGQRQNEVLARQQAEAEVSRLEALQKRSEPLRRIAALNSLAASDPHFALEMQRIIAKLESDDTYTIDNAYADVLTSFDKNDPKQKEVKLMLEVDHALDISQTLNPGELANLISQNPAQESQIRARAVNTLTQSFIFSDSDPDHILMRLQNMVADGVIDAKMAREVGENYQKQSTQKAQELLRMYDKGEIRTIEDLKQFMSGYPENSLVRTLIQERIDQDEAVQTWNSGTHTDDEVIAHAIENIAEPGKTIYKNVLEKANNQRDLEQESLKSEKAAAEAEADTLKIEKFEMTLKKIKIIAKFFGPAVLIGIGLGMGGGTLIGNLSKFSGAGILGVGLAGGVAGGLVGGLYGTGDYFLGGGYKEWKQLDSKRARAQANVDAAYANVGRMEGAFEMKKFNNLSLFTEVAVQSEVQKRGLRSPDQIQALRSQMLRQIGADPVQQRGFETAANELFNFSMN
jgi:hypothetical protein